MSDTASATASGVEKQQVSITHLTVHLLVDCHDRCETLYREWTRAGVRAISVSEAMLDDSLSGRLLRMILAAFSEYERSVIALRISSGRKQRVATQGSFHGGVPYGYRAVGNRRSPGHDVLQIDERQAGAVRMAFRLYDTTKQPLAEIAEQLNAVGYRTGRGRGSRRSRCSGSSSGGRCTWDWHRQRRASR